MKITEKDKDGSYITYEDPSEYVVMKTYNQSGCCGCLGCMSMAALVAVAASVVLLLAIVLFFVYLPDILDFLLT